MCVYSVVLLLKLEYAYDSLQTLSIYTADATTVRCLPFVLRGVNVIMRKCGEWKTGFPVCVQRGGLIGGGGGAELTFAKKTLGVGAFGAVTVTNTISKCRKEDNPPA